jgi:predicted transposase/invertase (TIGR01784 family)
MEGKSLQPHDWFFKQMFSNPKSLQTVLDLFIPTLATKLDLSSITLLNTEKFTKKSQKFMLDLLFSCKINNEDTFIRFVFEHKSYVDKTLPIQLLYYNAVIWEETIKQKEYYPPIINIVFYHGKQEWNVPTDLPAVKDKDLQEYTQKLKYLLIDLNRISDEELKNRLYQDVCTISAILTMKHIFEEVQNFKPIIKLLIEYKSDCLYTIFDYIVLVKRDIEKIEEVLKEVSGGDKKMMTLTEKWKLDGKLETLRENIIDLMDVRFGAVDETIVEKINKTNNIDTLRQILRLIGRSQSLDEVVKKLESL